MRCGKCKRFEPLTPDITGVIRGKNDEILFVTFDCECGTIRTIATNRTTMKQMADGRSAEINGMRTSAAL